MTKKTVHVHIHEYPGGVPLKHDDLDPQHRTRDSDEGGRWVTIHGAHVHIGEGGKIDKGPKHLVGMGEHGAHANEHAEKASGHRVAAKSKREEHGDHKAALHHERAAAAHSLAESHFREAEQHVASGNLKQAGISHRAGEMQAKEAARHEENLGKHQEEAKAAAPAFKKPAAHEKAHAEHAEAVRGSEQHEAEHKRLSKMYDDSKEAWERNAVNRLMEKNAAAGAQANAQALHGKAQAAHERAKSSGDPTDRRHALNAIEAADAAHSRAGGPGYLKRQQELHAMRKEHAPHVERDNMEQHAAGRVVHNNLQAAASYFPHARDDLAAMKDGETRRIKAGADEYEFTRKGDTYSQSKEAVPGNLNGVPLRTEGGKKISRPASATPEDDAKRAANRARK